MRKTLLFVVIVAIILFLGKSLKQSATENFPLTTPTIIPSSSPTPILKQTTEVTIAGKNYQVSWIKVGDVNRLSLYSNLAEKKTAEELKKKL